MPYCRVDHLHQVHDVEHGEPCGGLNIRPIRRHVGAFEDDGADLGVFGAEPLGDADVLSTRGLDVEDQLITQEDAGEFSLGLEAGHGDRRVWRDPGTLEVGRRQ